MTNEASFHIPTFGEKFWLALGFTYHLGEEPEDIDALVGWMRTDIRIDFSIADRVRLLLTGRLRVSSIVHSDTPSPMICKSRVDWKIVAPGDQP